MKEEIEIPMGTDPAPFWANIFLYSNKEQYMSLLIHSDKIKVKHFYLIRCFTDDFSTINDDGEFGRSFCDMYSKELKFEHQGDHVTFFEFGYNHKGGDLYIIYLIKEIIFPFSIVRIPHIENNIPQNVFYSTIAGYFSITSRSTLYLYAKELLEHIKQQISKPGATGNSLRKKYYLIQRVSNTSLLHVRTSQTFSQTFFFMCVYMYLCMYK